MLSAIDGAAQFYLTVVIILVVFVTATFISTACCAKKKEADNEAGKAAQRGGGHAAAVDATAANQPKPPTEADKNLPDAGAAAGGSTPASPKPPAQGGVVAINDPNYQTLAGMDNDKIFEERKKDGGNGDRAAAVPGACGAGPKAPEKGGVAGTFDPNYQTLAGVSADVFGEDKKKAGDGRGEGPKVPENKDAKAGTYDPNYQ
uniref:Uncharacterized protein n=1 Tax=Parascaris univalens TaxID=6257 RepID=A0A914ZWN3_PARUN